MMLAATENNTEPTFYECGQCKNMHPEGYSNPWSMCSPAATFTVEQLNIEFGEWGWCQVKETPTGRCPTCGGPAYGTRDQKCDHL